MQLFSLLAVFALVGFVSANKDLIVGHRESGDQLIEQKEITKGWLPFLVVQEEAVVTGDGNFRITRVEAIDIKKKETSAEAHIVSGGAGHSYVALKFVSARGHGIHFIVKVYGKRSY